MPRSRRRRIYERYELERSPFSQRPTQKKLAELLGMTRDDLRRNASYKEQCIIRRDEKINGKLRNLAYPVGPLRVIHEKLKFHLNKVKQPDFLFSPRKGMGQRDNAHHHLGNQQFLTLDLKQFYPSTTFSMVKSWLQNELGMMEDVAGLFAELATVDGVVSFGSPLTPVLVSMVHRKMFNEIANECKKRGLAYSVWVDDLTISGKMVEGDIVEIVRSIITSHGLMSHKVTYRFGYRPVFITGIGVVGSNLVAPQTLHIRIRDLWQQFHNAETDDEREDITQKLLAQMGTLRHITGPKSEMGRKTSDRMNSIRQKRDKWRRIASEKNNHLSVPAGSSDPSGPAPWD